MIAQLFPYIKIILDFKMMYILTFLYNNYYNPDLCNNNKLLFLKIK